jgi:hypothetical protein
MHRPEVDTLGLHSGGGHIVGSLPAEEKPLATVALGAEHQTASFKCSRSARVQGFFTHEWPELQKRNYCKVFVLENPSDPNLIWGYYTLSSAVLQKSNLSNSDEKRGPLGFHAPMVRIGFMGRDDTAEKGVGKILVVDAARRAARITDLGIWGIVLEPEGGKDTNPKLWNWYRSMQFTEARGTPSMYAPLQKLIG